MHLYDWPSRSKWGTTPRKTTRRKTFHLCNAKLEARTFQAKKITLSHTKTWQETPEDEKKKVMSENKKKAKEIAKINESTEKATLGDLETLKNLKENLEKSEKE